MEILVTINDWLWNPLVVLALGLGLTLTVLTRGVQFRLLPDMLRQIRAEKSGGKDATEGISSFQALALTLSSRIGVGNIAGVATAIAAGGPGALFWMGVMALLGSALAFVESTVAQIYKRKIDGRFWGGIPYYIERGLGLKWLAVVAAVTTIALYAVLAPGVQANNITAAIDTATGVSPWISGVVLTAAFAFVVFGGRKRVVGVADILVPVMAAGYILAAVVVLAVHAAEIPGAIALIVGSAFGTDSVFGGIVGAAVAWGVRRAMFSNVAGVGEGTYGAAAADVSHPVKQGLVQGFSIYIDTLFVCMATGLMIVVTGNYNVLTEDGQQLADNLPGVEAGSAFTQAAVSSVAPGVGPVFVAIAITLFAFTTLVAFYYISETALTYLSRTGVRGGWVLALRLVMIAVTMYASVQSADLIWAIGDVGYASLAWVNMLCLLFLAKPALRALRDYDAQRKRGLDPTFDPESAGIPNADYWAGDDAPARR
ncbi:alanine:cation symporter family protein [Streptomonospora sp. S1-112]|uniref:Alanine:cation symporter family protein n=1 Tax=Streptomonospora mangrovi TaxID=2883123 RepID=A0A9X3NSG5_9ACTN|nr:alanine/glycine:cation symporter family protein [Streptomonospora mangrovi]MDA0567513.1 alanine:cation symporter family protein [Streptomonospora mangrovi]